MSAKAAVPVLKYVSGQTCDIPAFPAYVSGNQGLRESCRSSWAQIIGQPSNNF